MKEAGTEQGTTEKITINLNVVELGYIDLLVNEGYYSNRTDFIKSAVRRQLDNHGDDTKKLLKGKEDRGYELSVGIICLTKKYLEEMLKKGEKKNVIFVGLFILPQDIPIELLQQTIESIKVHGICKCSREVKEFYSL